MLNRKSWYHKGLRDGIPIALGYFAVAFTLGIVAKQAGLSAFQAGLAAALTNASAGGYAGFTLIAANASYAEMALTQLVINARYLLMSCSLSQKLPESVGIPKRMLLAFDITDEIFGISMAVPGQLPLSYSASFAFARLPYLCNISSGMRVILLTVVLSLGAALLFPVKEDENAA